jgi:hypothetical protein
MKGMLGWISDNSTISAVRRGVAVVVVLLLAIGVAVWDKSLVLPFLPVALLVASLICLPEIKRLKVGPLETDMREAVEHAYATIEAMREVATTVIRAGLLQLSWGQLGSDIKSGDQHDLRDRYARLAAQLRLEDPSLSSSFDDFHRLKAREVLNQMLHRTREMPRLDLDRHERLARLQRDALHELPSLDVVREVIEPSLAADPEMIELLLDYEHYLQHHRHRRPEKHW